MGPWLVEKIVEAGIGPASRGHYGWLAVDKVRWWFDSESGDVKGPVVGVA